MPSVNYVVGVGGWGGKGSLGRMSASPPPAVHARLLASLEHGARHFKEPVQDLEVRPVAHDLALDDERRPMFGLGTAGSHSPKPSVSAAPM